MTPFEEQIFFKMALRLSEADAFLIKGNQDYGVMVRKNKWQKSVVRVAENLVDLFYREELLLKSEAKDIYALSKMGYAKNNRHHAGSLGFLAQHGGLAQAAEGASISLSSHPLKALYGRSQNSSVQITDTEFKSAERLYIDYEISLRQTNLSVDWSRPISRGQRSGGSDRSELPDRVLDAHKRLEATFDFVGPYLSDILKLVCCQQYGLEAAEKKLK